MKKLFWFMILAAVFLTISGVAQSATKNVSVLNYSFSPKTVKIKKGSTVRWIFKEGSHNVVGKGWQSPVKSSGSYKKKFTRKGTFSYVCTLHPGMNGKVIVTR